MSREAALAWLSQTTADTIVAGAEAAEAAEDPLAFLVQAGAREGFEFTGTELIQAAGAPAEDELSEGELEKVAGGSPIARYLSGLELGEGVP